MQVRSRIMQAALGGTALAFAVAASVGPRAEAMTAVAPAATRVVSTLASPASPASVAAAPAVVVSGLRVGSSGAQVLALQQRLNALGYWVGRPDGRFGGMTRQGVLGVQKAAGLPRTGYVGTATATALNKGIRPKARSTRGHVIEVDKAKQLLLVVDNGRVGRIYPVSTGSGERYWDNGWQRAVTPSGTYRFWWQVANGWQHGRLGDMYRPMYFNRGIAVHGTKYDVGAYPASHGCVRVTNAAMDELRRTGAISIGGTVVVY